MRHSVIGGAHGYDKGSAISYVGNFRGELLLHYGTSDNTVHNTNTRQPIKALEGAGRQFEVQMGPDGEHAGMTPSDRMMNFLSQNLVVRLMYRLAY